MRSRRAIGRQAILGYARRVDGRRKPRQRTSGLTEARCGPAVEDKEDKQEEQEEQEGGELEEQEQEEQEWHEEQEDDMREEEMAGGE